LEYNEIGASMMGGTPRPYCNSEGQRGLGRARSENVAIAVRHAMVERQAEDATIFVERSAEPCDRSQTQG